MIERKIVTLQFEIDDFVVCGLVAVRRKARKIKKITFIKSCARHVSGLRK